MQATWDRVAEKMCARPYYVMPHFAAYKKAEFYRCLDAWCDRPYELVLKTDSFEEAFGAENIIAWLCEHSQTVISADISACILTQAREKTVHGKIRYVSMNIDQMPFSHDSFDFVFSSSTLGYARDIKASLAQLFCIMRPGTRALISVNNRKNLLFRFLTGISVFFGIIPFPVSMSFSEVQMRDYLSATGFHVDHSRTIVHILPLFQVLLRVLSLIRCETFLLNLLNWYSTTDLAIKKYTGWFTVYCITKQGEQ
jgi:SAM-dependent methyltransferase